MTDRPLAPAHRLLSDGLAALRAVSDNGADADTRISALLLCEGITRQVEQLSVELIGGLDRAGVFTERGYSRPAGAVADLLGCDAGQAWRRVRAAEHVTERVSLDGQLLPPRLPATGAAFAEGQISLRHVEVIVDALATPAAGRLTRWTAIRKRYMTGWEFRAPGEITLFRPKVEGVRYRYRGTKIPTPWTPRPA